MKLSYRYPPEVEKYLRALDEMLDAIDKRATDRLKDAPSIRPSAESLIRIERQRQAEAEPIFNEKARVVSLSLGNVIVEFGPSPLRAAYGPWRSMQEAKRSLR